MTTDCFRIIHACPDSDARAGELITTHGVVPTPVFMPVGSQATVKTVTPDELKAIGINMVLANTYHLYLRPGADIIKKIGGLHRFMAWDQTLLTDSGGFQVFSLARLRKVNDEGVVFRSHLDGSQHLITPELCIQLQETLGADVIMVLDQCPSVEDDEQKVRQAMSRTHHWAERCLQTHTRQDQLLFGIVQGGFSAELRRESAGYLASLDFPGYAIGGLSLGEPKELTYETLEATMPFLPADKPRYLMGVGAPEDLLNGIARGVDMFDCVLPTRLGRNGGFFTKEGRQNIRNSRWKEVTRPIDTDCACYTCRHFSAAYLHHLFRCEELLAYRLATIHNLYFMQKFMEGIRQAILDGNFTAFKDNFLAGYKTTDEQVRTGQKQKWLNRHTAG